MQTMQNTFFKTVRTMKLWLHCLCGRVFWAGINV